MQTFVYGVELFAGQPKASGVDGIQVLEYLKMNFRRESCEAESYQRLISIWLKGEGNTYYP